MRLKCGQSGRTDQGNARAYRNYGVLFFQTEFIYTHSISVYLY